MPSRVEISEEEFRKCLIAELSLQHKRGSLELLTAKAKPPREEEEEEAVKGDNDNSNEQTGNNGKGKGKEGRQGDDSLSQVESGKMNCSSTCFTAGITMKMEKNRAEESLFRGDGTEGEKEFVLIHAYDQLCLDFPLLTLGESSVLNKHFYQFILLFVGDSNCSTQHKMKEMKALLTKTPFCRRFMDGLCYRTKPSEGMGGGVEAHRRLPVEELYLVVVFGLVPGLMKLLTEGVAGMIANTTSAGGDLLKLAGDIGEIFELVGDFLNGFEQGGEEEEEREEKRRQMKKEGRWGEEELEDGDLGIAEDGSVKEDSLALKIELEADVSDASDFEYEPLEMHEQAQDGLHTSFFDSMSGASVSRNLINGKASRNSTERGDPLQGLLAAMEDCFAKMNTLLGLVDGSYISSCMTLGLYDRLDVKTVLKRVFVMCKEGKKVCTNMSHTGKPTDPVGIVKKKYCDLIGELCIGRVPNVYGRVAVRLAELVPAHFTDLAKGFVDSVFEGNDHLTANNALLVTIVSKFCSVRLGGQYSSERDRFVDTVLQGFAIPRLVRIVLSKLSLSPKKRGCNSEAEKDCLLEARVWDSFDGIIRILMYFMKYYCSVGRRSGAAVDNILLTTGIWRDLVGAISGNGNAFLEDAHKHKLFGVFLMGCVRFKELWDYARAVKSFAAVDTSIISEERSPKTIDNSDNEVEYIYVTLPQRQTWRILCWSYSQPSESTTKAVSGRVSRSTVPFSKEREAQTLNILEGMLRRALDIVKEVSQVRLLGMQPGAALESVTIQALSLKMYRDLQDVLTVIEYLEFLHDSKSTSNSSVSCFNKHSAIPVGALDACKRFYCELQEEHMKSLNIATKKDKPLEGDCDSSDDDEFEMPGASNGRDKDVSRQGQANALYHDMMELSRAVLKCMKPYVVGDSVKKQD